jgi:hypothetical protein
MSAGDSTFNKFDAKAKSEVFAKVFDVGLPMWKTLGLKVAAEMTTKPEKILSVGDGPGEPGCFLAAQFGCEAISSDSVCRQWSKRRRSVWRPRGSPAKLSAACWTCKI